MSTVTTWLDGRIQTVAADDPRLGAIETARHIANLHRITPARARVAYFDEYERGHGRANFTMAAVQICLTHRYCCRTLIPLQHEAQQPTGEQRDEL